MTSQHYQIQPFGDGIWVCIATEDGYAAANAGIIDMGDRTLVFDTSQSIVAATELRAAAERLTGRPVSYVVNSHYHADHINGNQVFANACFFATAGTRDLMAARTLREVEATRLELPDHLKQMEESLNAQADPEQRRIGGFRLARLRALWQMLPEFQLISPHVTFTDRLWLHGTKRSVELITFGGGHTDSDSFLYLPAERMAFMGDLLFVRHQPWLGDGNPEQWVRIIDQVRPMAIDTLVPGHGQPGTMADAELIQAYIRTVLSMAAQPAAPSGEAVIPAAFQTWEAGQLLAANLNFLRSRVVMV